MNYGLTDDQLASFHRQGFVGPLGGIDTGEIDEIHDGVREEVLRPDDYPLEGKAAHRGNDRHRDSPAVWGLVSHPAVAGRVRDVLGSDLAVWSSNLWDKPPGAPAVPWHQGSYTHPIHPQVTVTAWIALTEVDRDNGCLELVPETNRRPIPHVEADSDVFDDAADTSAFDPSSAVPMELAPGEFCLFAARTVHGSSANDSDRRRTGLSARYIPPSVNVDERASAIYDDYRVVQVTGTDEYGLNDTAAPPTDT